MTSTKDIAGKSSIPAGLRSLLICPCCRATFHEENGTLTCARCSATFPVVGGIPCFASTSEFYDQYSEEHAPYVRSPRGWKRAILRFLPFWSWREWRFWEAEVPHCERLLDLGSGRGKETFAERAAVSVGYDVSMRFASEAARQYTHAVQGRLPRLPFPDQLFDVVVSSHVLGHIPRELKDELISEIARVLRPGGRSVHLIETDSAHPAVLEAKRTDHVYRAQFVEQDGHIGLEPASAALARFADAGLLVERVKVSEAVVISRQNYEKYFAHPAYQDHRRVRRMARMTRLSRSSAPANAAYEVCMGAFHHTLEQWLGRRDHAQFLMASFRRR